jgi:predicted RND superfamily exporter protein
MAHLEELNVSRFNRVVVGLIAAHPWGAIALGVLLLVGLAPGLLRLKTDFTHTGFFNADDPKLQKFEEFEKRFGNDDTVVIAVHSPSGVYDTATITLVQRLTDQLWRVPEVIRVESVANYNWLHGKEGEIVVEPFLPRTPSPERLAERRRLNDTEHILPRYLISDDQRTTLVIGRIKPAIDRPPDSAAITRALRAIAAQARVTDETLHLQGTPVVTYGFEEVTIEDLARLVPLVVALAAVFLFLILRSVVAIVLPFVTVSASLICAFGMAGWAGLVQVPLSTAIPSILIAVGIADTVHVVFSFVGALRAGASQRDAARYALMRNMLPTFLTSLTTAVGFFSFMSAPLKPLAMLGIVTGFGTAVTWVFAFVVCGGALFVLPFRIAPRPDVSHAVGLAGGGWLVAFAVAHRRAVLLGTVTVVAVSCWYALGMDVSTDPIKYFSRDVPVRQAHELLEREMQTSRSIELVVESGREGGALDAAFLEKVDELERALAQDPSVTLTLSIVDTLKQVNQALADGDPAAYALPDDNAAIAQQMLLYTLALPPGMDLNDRITVREDALRVTLVGNHENSTAAVALVDRAIALGAERSLDVWATGKYFLYQETSDYVVQSLLRSIAGASLVIGLIMAVMLRSIRLGIISMIPNIVPLFVAGATLRLLGRPLDLGTAMVASVALGICIDDTSQILANYARVRRDGLAAVPALYRVMEHSLPSLLSTNGVLIASFASFVVATYIPNMVFGLLTSFVFVVALIADLMLTPVLLLPRRIRPEPHGAGHAGERMRGTSQPL